MIGWKCEELIITQLCSPLPQQTPNPPTNKGNNSHTFLNVDSGSQW